MENQMTSNNLTEEEKTKKFNEFFTALNNENNGDKLKFYNGFIDLLDYNSTK